MTTIKVGRSEDDGRIDFIEIAGHSNFASAGQDIVCASISSSSYLITNMLGKYLDDNMDYTECDDLLRIDVYKTDDITEIMLDNFVDMMEELKKQFPENVSVIYI